MAWTSSGSRKGFAIATASGLRCQDLFNVTADEQMRDEASAKDLIDSRDAISFP